MRNVEIVTTESEYAAGQTVEGHMIVRCDKEFKCNATHLTITGREHTAIEVGDGDTSTTYRDERVFLAIRADFVSEGVMAMGETHYPFQFRLPDDVPSSYSGVHAWIEYTLTGVVEVSWATDPKSELTIGVIQPMADATGRSQSQSIEKRGRPALEVELEDDVVCLGSPLRLRFRVVPDVKIRGVRVELQGEEHAVAKRERRQSRRRLVGQVLDGREVPRDTWTDLELPTDESMPVSLERELVRNDASLKVTLDVPWARDKSVVIPVRLGHCASASVGRETDGFGSRWRTG